MLGLKLLFPIIHQPKGYLPKSTVNNKETWGDIVTQLWNCLNQSLPASRTFPLHPWRIPGDSFVASCSSLLRASITKYTDWMASIAETCFLTVLEARMLRSRWWQVWFLLRPLSFFSQMLPMAASSRCPPISFLREHNPPGHTPSLLLCVLISSS